MGKGEFGKALEKIKKAIEMPILEVKDEPEIDIEDIVDEIGTEELEDIEAIAIDVPPVEEVIVKTSTLPWSNGHDSDVEEDITEYEIKYLLNKYTFIFKIHISNDSEEIIYASVLIDNWFNFILQNHNGELGYYQEDGVTGIQTFLETEADLFFQEYNIKDIYQDKKLFFINLLQATFICVVNELNVEYENDLDDMLESITF